jgi:hypothetical protein
MALEEHIKKLCPPDTPAIQRLRKRVALERFLGRLQEPVKSPYLLKGAFALYLRFGSRARVTQDLDLGTDSSHLDPLPSSPSGISEDLQKAAATPFDDFFAFRILGEGEPIKQEPDVRAYRFSVQAILAGRPFENFRLDVGGATKLVAPPEEIRESDLLAFAGIAPKRFRAVSLVQQFAEKVHALTFPWQDRENTRVKDLVDLALILELAPPDPFVIRTALDVVFGHRGSHSIPAEIPDPPASWAAMYARSAAESGIVHAELSDAVLFLREYWARVFP